MSLSRLIFVFALVIGASKALAQEDIVLSMSHDQVSITTNFNGSQIIIFGAVKREIAIPDTPLHVLVTVSGPKQPVQVRRKAKKFGIWINTDTVEVDEAPSFYAVATTGPWSDTISDIEDLRYKISIPRAIRSVGAPQTVSDSQNFTDALIRINKNNGLYALLPNSVTLKDSTLFHTAIDLPANLVEGDYETRVFLTRDQKVISEYNTMLDVRKVGLERFLYNLSRQTPLIYALLSLIVAGFCGWAASAIFQIIRAR